MVAGSAHRRTPAARRGARRGWGTAASTALLLVHVEGVLGRDGLDSVRVRRGGPLGRMHRHDPTLFDALAEHRAQRVPQGVEFGAAQGCGQPFGVDAVDEQRLETVDVPHPAHELLVQQGRADGGRAPPEPLPGPVGVGVAGQQVGPEPAEDLIAAHAVDELTRGGADEVERDARPLETQLRAGPGRRRS